MSNELPGEWGTRLGPKGIHSYRDMAAAVGAGISQGTMHRLVTGGATSTVTVNRVADALFGGDRDLVWRLRGSRRRDYGDWNLPPEASLLTEEQRSAVLAVVQAMVPAEREEGDRHDSAAATKVPEAGPAEQPAARSKRQAGIDREADKALDEIHRLEREYRPTLPPAKPERRAPGDTSHGA